MFMYCDISNYKFSRLTTCKWTCVMMTTIIDINLIQYLIFVVVLIKY